MTCPTLCATEKGCQLSPGLGTTQGTSWKAGCGYTDVAGIGPRGEKNTKKQKSREKKKPMVIATQGCDGGPRGDQLPVSSPHVKTEGQMGDLSVLSPPISQSWPGYFWKPQPRLLWVMSARRRRLPDPASSVCESSEVNEPQPRGTWGCMCEAHLRGGSDTKAGRNHWDKVNRGCRGQVRQGQRGVASSGARLTL